MRSTMDVARGLLLVLALLPAAAFSQSGHGKIEGSIVRENGSGLGGVSVVADTGEATVTGAEGEFRLHDIPAGSHTVTFTLGEFSQTSDEVQVAAGETAPLDLTVDWDVSFAETITVMSASRRLERIVEAPAAITVITEVEIERAAASGQLPKLLEYTPGAELTQSGVYDFNFNTRGFNSSLNRRVQTLIDGRNPSVPFLGAQEWAALSFPLDDLASVELVRGPSAALYGANASSGVLNMISREPRYSSGGQIRLTGGELSTLNGDVRWAGSLGKEWYGKAVAGFRNHGDFTVSRNGQAEYAVPCTASGQTDCLPQERVPLDPENDDKIYFGGLRLDKYFGNGKLMTVEGGTASIEGPVFQTGIGRVQLVEVDRPWARFNINADHWNFLSTYSKRDAPKQTALGAGTNLALDTSRVSAELQGNWGFVEDKVQLVLGGSYVEEDLDSEDPETGNQTLMFAPVKADMQALFGQIDWAISDKLKLVLAGRYDKSTLHESQFSPKGSLVYAVNPNHTFRLSYNEAFQVANYSEFFLQANVAAPLSLQPFEAFCTPFGVDCGFAPGPTRILALGNEDLELEQVKSWEIGYSGIIGSKAFVTVDYYQSKNDNFITDLLPQLGTSLGRINPNFGPYQTPDGLPAPVAAALQAALQGALGPSYFILTNNLDGTPILGAVSYTNFGEVDTQGIELGLNLYFGEGWNAMFNYSWFDFEIKDPEPGLSDILQPNAPENTVSAGLGYAKGKWDGNLSVRWVDEFRWVVGPFQGDVESYSTVNLGGNYLIADRWRVGINVSNLLDNVHYEAFGGDLLERRALAHVAYLW